MNNPPIEAAPTMGMNVPPYDPANPMFGPTDVGLSWSVEDTEGGPVALMGFRTSNTTFTVPFTSSQEIEDFLVACKKMLMQMKAKEVRAQLQIPAGLFVPDHIAKGESMEIPRVKVKDSPQA